MVPHASNQLSNRHWSCAKICRPRKQDEAFASSCLILATPLVTETEKYWMSHPVFTCMSDVLLSTNGVIDCESYNLQAGLKSPRTGAKRPQSGPKRSVSGRNSQVAKLPDGETSSGWVKRPGGETSSERVRRQRG